MTDLNCDELVELVTGYLDGALDGETAQRVADHLAACDGCTTYVDQMRQTVSALGSSPAEAELPDEVRDALLAAFRERSD
ncbi:MAG TPA: zf-HC2 domain-containing protein [Acidimicrobiales bacterium]|nr:zf-HC2 domain-containing protein [Acidimicrobiales bacterium]